MTKTAKTTPITFKIKGEEHPLLLNFTAVKYLNDIYEGGTFELIGKALMGDLDTFPELVYAGLRYTPEAYEIYDIEEALDEAVLSGELSFKDILRMSNQLVAENSFYKSTVDNLLKQDKGAKKAIADLIA